MNKTKKLILFGDSAFAEIAFEYFTHDSIYEVVAITISKKYIKNHTFLGLPVVPFEDIENIYPPSDYEMHIALVYNSLNRIRKNFYNFAKLKGYKLANYLSSSAFVWHNVQLGDNIFIFEDNTIQPFVRIGSNNVFWSGNHIGHHTNIGSHNFFSSHVVVSGFCNIENSNFFGVNSTIANNLNIGSDCLIGSFAHIGKDVLDGSLMRGKHTDLDPKSTWDKLKIQRDED